MLYVVGFGYMVYLFDLVVIKIVFVGNLSVFYVGEVNLMLVGLFGDSLLLLIDDDVYCDWCCLMLLLFYCDVVVC